MPTIKVNTRKLASYESDLQRILNRVNSIKNEFSSTSSNLDWDVKASSNINYRLSVINRELSAEVRGISGLKNYLDTAQRKYDAVEDKNGQKRKDSLKAGHVKTVSISSSHKRRINKLIDELFARFFSKPGYSGLKNQLISYEDGKIVFDKAKVLEYMRKYPGQITDVEQADLLEVIGNIPDTLSFYSSLVSLQGDSAGINIGNYKGYADDDVKYTGITGISGHLGDLFINIFNGSTEMTDDKLSFGSSLANINYKDSFLDVMKKTLEIGDDKATFAATLLSGGIGNNVLSLLGVEASKRLEIFGKDSLEGYIAKFETENTEHSFGNLEFSDKLSEKGKINGDPISDKLEDFAKDKGWREEDKDTKYYDAVTGEEISKEDAPDFYKKKATVAELKKEASVTASIYDGNFSNTLGQGGNTQIVVGQAEAHASIAGGLYVIGADGKNIFSPGVNAEIGTSVTVFELKNEQQWLGDDMLGLNSEATVTAGKAEAKASFDAQFLGEGGKVDPQLALKASAEAIAGEVEGSVGVNILGGEVEGKVGVNFGIGAHADLGYKDGVIKADVGLSVGLGVSAAVEIDIGGMVNTVVDGAEAVWDGACDLWDSLWS